MSLSEKNVDFDGSEEYHTWGQVAKTIYSDHPFYYSLMLTCTALVTYVAVTTNPWSWATIAMYLVVISMQLRLDYKNNYK